MDTEYSSGDDFVDSVQLVAYPKQRKVPTKSDAATPPCNGDIIVLSSWNECSMHMKEYKDLNITGWAIYSTVKPIFSKYHFFL